MLHQKAATINVTYVSWTCSHNIRRSCWTSWGTRPCGDVLGQYREKNRSRFQWLQLNDGLQGWGLVSASSPSGITLTILYVHREARLNERNSHGDYTSSPAHISTMWACPSSVMQLPTLLWLHKPALRWSFTPKQGRCIYSHTELEKWVWSVLLVRTHTHTHTRCGSCFMCRGWNVFIQCVWSLTLVFDREPGLC